MEAAGVPSAGLSPDLGPVQEHHAATGASEVVSRSAPRDPPTDNGDVVAPRR